MSHQKHDILSLALAQRISDGLKQHPEWIALAKANLDRWSEQNAGVPSLLARYREWRAILELSIEEISAALLDPTDRGQALRQNSPFVGALSPEEVWRMKRQARETTTA